jgi:hypothetical protein
MFLFALNIGGLSNGSQLSLSLLGAAVSLAWGWRLLPAEGRRQFLAVAGMRG